MSHTERRHAAKLSALCGQSRPPRLLALALAAAGPLYLGLQGMSMGFSAAWRLRCSSSNRGPVVRRRAAGSDFSYGKAKGGKGFSDGNAQAPKKKKQVEAQNEDDDEEVGIVKDPREGKSGKLSTTKLKDLRDKTLATRQKREAELDEYEEGRAMIAKYGPKVAVMPPKVAERAAKRGMVIGGSFYGTMLACFAGGILLYKTQDLIIPPTLMAFVTLALVALAIAGSSYGLMSASWEEDKEGSVLGVEEFGNNVKAIGEGFRKATMQNEYDKALDQRKERKALLQAKEDKKRELLNK